MYLGAFTVCTMLSINEPIMAQTTDNTTVTADRTNDDDGGKWGLAGLLGLLGLLGLRGRDNDKHRTTTTTNR